MRKNTSITQYALITLLAISASAPSFALSNLNDCDRADSHYVLQADQLPSARAQAVWTSANQIHWPLSHPLQANDTIRLYSSAQGKLKISKGKLIVESPGLQLQTRSAQAQRHPTPAFRYLPTGWQFELALADTEIKKRLATQLIVAHEDANGILLEWTYLQHATALDQLYASASNETLGPSFSTKINSADTPGEAQLKLWAPTAHAVQLCQYPDTRHKASRQTQLQHNPITGVWQSDEADHVTSPYYLYLIDVFVPGVGLVRNRVTDPYSISLSADSARSYFADLNSPQLKPRGWDQHQRPAAIYQATDLSFYELHLRDFSIADETVPQTDRGKYRAFRHTNSNGMRHLRDLAQAGLTDIHLLPIFDFSTVPERHCVNPRLRSRAADLAAQRQLRRLADKDCYNWGYDPLHYNAPEGSYASNANDAAVRIRELREMIMAIHQLGLRVGMDVVYNHTAFAGQNARSILDRIVPGYYHRLNAEGKVEDSTCQPCGNTATENRMMAKLMQDSVRLWAREYQIDSFRFDLMGHQPRAAMEQLHQQLQQDNQRPIHLIGEGWNFGEVANNQRFVQASQLNLQGSQIASFNDRLRDALRGGGHGDNAATLRKNQGYINGLLERDDLSLTEKQRVADLVRLGLAGSVAQVRMENARGEIKTLAEYAYGDQAAGYGSQASEVVNYVENHDNATLYDLNLYRMPANSSAAARVQAQVLGLGFSILAQGLPYLHAGSEILRSKSLDQNSYNSGDWFNALDWRYRSNGFGRGLPPINQPREYYPLMRPLLANPALQASPDMILQSKVSVLDLLRIRYSSPLFRLNSASEIQQRLRFHNTGPQQNPALIVMELDGSKMPDSAYRKIVVVFNSATSAQQIQLNALQQLPLQLHPVHLQVKAGDQRIAHVSVYDKDSGNFSVPALSISCFVVANKN